MTSNTNHLPEVRLAEIVAEVQAQAQLAEHFRLVAEVATDRAALADERIRTMTDEIKALRQRDRQMRVALAALSEANRHAERRTPGQVAPMPEARMDALPSKGRSWVKAVLRPILRSRHNA